MIATQSYRRKIGINSTLKLKIIFVISIACTYNAQSFTGTFQNVVNYLCYHPHTELGKVDAEKFMSLQEKGKSKKGHNTLRHFCCMTDIS